MNESTNYQAAQGSAVPNLDVRIYPQAGKENVLAFASVNIGGVFAVNDVRVMDSRKGKFVAMPSRKTNRLDKDGNAQYRDICFPVTKEMREAFNGAVLRAYEQALQKESVRGALKAAEQEAASRAASAPAKATNRGAR